MTKRVRVLLPLLAAISVVLAGCGHEPKIKIQLFSMMQAQTCEVYAKVANDSDHHISAISFTINSQQFRLSQEQPAHQTSNMLVGNLPVVSNTCRGYLSMLEGQRGKIQECSMPDVSEGDCQKDVEVSVNKPLPWYLAVR